MPDLSSLATPVLSSIPSPANLRTVPNAPEPKHAFGSFQKATNHVRSQSLTFGKYLLCFVCVLVNGDHYSSHDFFFSEWNLW